MKIKKLFYEKMNLTHEEIESFGVVENVLQSLYEAYGEGMLLTDLTTGECIGPTKFPEIPVSLERNTEVFRHPLL